MKRLIVVYNPRSSHFAQVKADVIDKLRDLKGVAVGKFEVADTNVDDNAQRLAKVLSAGDLVIAAGGDGTATIAINGILLSKKANIKFGVVGYGNFNDVARAFGNLKLKDILNGRVEKVYPLECRINGRHWRYGMCYFTMGMFAEACAVFDKPKTRKSLRKGKKTIFYSLFTLIGWWLKNHRRKFLPESFQLADSSGDSIECKKVSDYMAVNGRSVAKIMKGADWFKRENDFLSMNGRMTKFFKLVSMMLRAVFKRIPGSESDYDCLMFDEPTSIMIQAEGEYKMVDGVKKIEVQKVGVPLLAVVK